MTPIRPTTSGAAVLPFTALAFSQVLFGSNAILGRAVEGHVPPVGLSFWRWVVAALIILPFAWPGLKRNARLLARSWRILLILTVCIVGLGNTAIYIALNWTTAINGSLIAVSQPAPTFILSWLLFRETVTKGQIAGVVVTIAGVLTVMTKGDIRALGEMSFNVGDLWMLVSALGFASYGVLLRLVPKDLPPLVLLNILQFMGVLFLLPFYLWESSVFMEIELDWVTVGAVAWAALAVATAAFGLWNWGVSMVGANRASVFVNIRIFAITVMAMMLLDEAVEAYHLLAFVLTFAGIYMVARPKSGAASTGERR